MSHMICHTQEANQTVLESKWVCSFTHVVEQQTMFIARRHLFMNAKRDIDTSFCLSARPFMIRIVANGSIYRRSSFIVE